MPAEDFKENAKKFRCCCSCVHITTAAIVLATLESVYLIFMIIDSILMRVRVQSSDIPFSLSLVGAVIGLVAIALLCWGIRTTKPYLLIPHLVMQVVAVLILIGMIALCLAALITGTAVMLSIVNATESKEKYGAMASAQKLTAASADFEQQAQHHFVSSALSFFLLLLLFVFLIGAIVEIYLINVVWRCYRYLGQKSQYKSATEAGFFRDNGTIEVCLPMNIKNSSNKQQEPWYGKEE